MSATDLCICGHYAYDHYTLGHPDHGGLRLGGCAAHRGTVRSAWEQCDCPRFDAFAGYEEEAS